MDTDTKTTTLEALEVLDYWKQIPKEDISPLKLNQKTENSIATFIDVLNEISTAPVDPSSQYLSFVWSVSVRDFVILLRDSLLATVKEEQLKKDDREVAASFTNDIQSIIQQAAGEVSNEYSKSSDSGVNDHLWRHQQTPVFAVIKQLKELQIQTKKIYRSSAKIDTIRFNINDYVKDFQLQYSRQANAVKQLFSIIEEVKLIIQNVTTESSEKKINKVVDQIGECSQKMEQVQGTESIDILPYGNNETLSIPISTTNGIVNYKMINIKSEFARWFSSLIYPKIIELESKRDHAVEKCLLALSQIRTKIAAISLAELGDSVNLQNDFESIFSKLNKEVLEALKQEENEANELVLTHQNKYLLASNVYSSDVLFLPENGRSPMSNLSKDAQKRIVSRIEKYSTELNTYFNKVLSRYVEVNKTPYSQFVKNQVSIYDKDDSLALFLKKGYLGKSFTVQRPELINPMMEEYKLWLDGFAGAVLYSGLTGSGKSTLLGMINHIGLNEEIIQLKTGESFFIQHRSYDPIYNFKELIDQILHSTRGNRVILCIDDLEQWHNEDNELFDNITKLFEAIVKFRKKIFFVVTCSPFLKDRLRVFKDLKTIFSTQTELGRMSFNQIKNALNLRVRVNDLVDFEDNDVESTFGNIIRTSKGNVGAALMEYCRYYNDDYQPNVKSQEFNDLIHSYHTLLTYICSYHHCSIKVLSDSLSEIDFRETIKSVEHLIGQKILIRPRLGFVAINPLLTHTIEQILLKY